MNISIRGSVTITCKTCRTHIEMLAGADNGGYPLINRAQIAMFLLDHGPDHELVVYG